MRTRYLVSGLLAAALISSPAFAQTSTPPAGGAPKADVGSPKLETPHWRSSKLIGVNIYNEQNEKLGDINEIILDKDGKVLGYVIGVGGFLGMGEHDIFVEPSKIKFVNEPARSASTGNNTNTNTTATNNANNTAPTNTRNASNTSGSARSANEQWYPDHAMMSGASKDQLKAMPQFKYGDYKG